MGSCHGDIGHGRSTVPSKGNVYGREYLPSVRIGNRERQAPVRMLVRKVVHPLSGDGCGNDGELEMTNLVARKFWDGKVLHVIGAHIQGSLKNYAPVKIAS